MIQEILRLVLAGLALLLAAFSASADVSIHAPTERTFAFGGVLGHPTGLTAHYRLDSDAAVQGAAGIPGFGNSDLLLTGDYVTQIDFWKFKTKDHPIYWGLGGYARGDKGGLHLALRLPLNLLLYFSDSRRFQGFFQVVPMIRIVPGIVGEGAIALGLRYFID